MIKRKHFVNKLSNFQRIIGMILMVTLGLVSLSSITTPTLSRYNHRITGITASVWDGSVASTYASGTGTKEDPYVISNGSELAYFSSQLSSNDYENTYFILNNDIMLNEGIFKYDDVNGIQYILNNQYYYVDTQTNKYYDNADRVGTEVGIINTLQPLDGFKGRFDGRLFTIYGLYISDIVSDKVSLFINLQGDITNIYVENAMIYGGMKTAGIAANTDNSSLSNILLSGYIVGKNAPTAVAGGIVAIGNNTTIKDTVNKALVYGQSISAGLIGIANSTININRTYNTGNIKSDNIGGGLIGSIENNSNNDSVISKSYNTGSVTAPLSGGLIGNVTNNTNSITISNVFNAQNIYSIGALNNTTMQIDNVYIIDGSAAINVNNGTITGTGFNSTTMNELKTKNFDVSTLLFNEFVSFDDLITNEDNVWIYKDNVLPTLFVDDNIADGYSKVLTIGRSVSSYPTADPYVSNKSLITLNFSYSNFPSASLNGYTHHLISSVMLPIGTKITLLDNITNKIYGYQVTTAENSIPFTSFKEIGTTSNDKPFIENTYYDNGVINENFIIVLDLSDTNIITNIYNVNLSLELRDADTNIIRPTLIDTLNNFNIYSNVSGETTNASLSLSTDYQGNAIEYNSDSSTDINLTSKLIYKQIDGHNIIDTTYEDKTMGLSIKLVDSDGNVVDKAHLRNIIFKIGNAIYYPEADNMIHINLNNGINDVTKKLTIITSLNNDDLKDGTYYFKISNYLTDDGNYHGMLDGTVLSIPVNVSNNSLSLTYGFGVIMDDTNIIINKNAEEVSIPFNILQTGDFENPNIKVSLYKKDELTAFNQNYSIVNLADYVSDNLNVFENNVYYVSTDPIKYEAPDYLYNNFTLNLITNKFENTGYKFVFDLFDGTKKIGTITKYFVVKEE